MDRFTTSQLRAFAVAPKPPAVLSFFSSAYVILRIVRSRRRKRRRQDSTACRDRGEGAACSNDGTETTTKRHRRSGRSRGGCCGSSSSSSSTTTYDRLVLGMSCNTLLQSVVYFWGTWAMPPLTGEGSTSSPAHMLGNFGTCTAQGVLVQITYCAVPFYYAVLCLYGLVFVKSDGGIARHRRHRRTIRKIEPYVHASAYVSPLITCIAVGKAQMFNPAGSVCWIEGYPMGCGSEGGMDCVRGRDGAVDLYIGLAGLLPLLLFLALALGSVSALYYSEWRRDEELRLAGTDTLAGKLRRNEVTERRKRRDAVGRLALAHLTAFVVTSVFGLAAQIVRLSTGRESFVALILSSVAWPLQGFVNAALYSLLPPLEVWPGGSTCTAPEVRSSAACDVCSSSDGRRRTSSLSQLSDDDETLEKRLEKGLEKGDATSKRNSSRKLSEGSHNMMRPLGQHHQMARKGSHLSRGSFSIYDGSEASDVWRDYVFEDDPDDFDPYDYTDETGRMQQQQQQQQRGVPSQRHQSMPMPSVIRVFGAQGGHGGGKVAPALGRNDLTSSSSGDSMDRFNGRNVQSTEQQQRQAVED